MVLGFNNSTTEHNNLHIDDYFNSVRLTVMYKLPEKKEIIDEDNPVTLGIQKINAMLKALTNKINCRICPWK